MGNTDNERARFRGNRIATKTLVFAYHETNTREIFQVSKVDDTPA